MSKYHLYDVKVLYLRQERTIKKMSMYHLYHFKVLYLRQERTITYDVNVPLIRCQGVIFTTRMYT